MKTYMDCLICSKNFFFYPGRSPYRKFCSKNCQSLSYVIQKIIKNCIICHEEFSYLERSARTNANYCSSKCYGVSVRERKSFWSKATESEKFQRIIENFERMVIRNSDDSCWGWKGSLSQGYSTIKTGSSSGMHASRFSWIMHNGTIDSRKTLVCHSCDNRECTNPKHLFLGTHKDNAQDASRKGRLKVWIGENHPYASLAEIDVKEIRNLLKNKIKQRDIAKLFNVDQTTISCINLRKTWKSLED